MRQRRLRRRLPLVNVVPLVDVLVMLLFFFVLMVPFHHKFSPLKIRPPEMKTAQAASVRGAIELMILPDGAYALEGYAIEKEEVIPALKERLKEDPDLKAWIFADETAPVKALAGLMDLCQQAGVPQVQLEAR
jgi:biopolymer transport protein ExbD